MPVLVTPPLIVSANIQHSPYTMLSFFKYEICIHSVELFSLSVSLLYSYYS